MQSENNLNYRKIGNGFPVVFLHGFLESLTMWNGFDLENFPFESILVDLPGHGNSSLTDDGNPSLDFMAIEVQKLLKSISVKNYHVIGHSMGGYVALLLKEMDPNCQKVIMMNSNYWEDSPEKKKDRVRVADIALKAKNLFINEAIPGLFYRHSRKDLIVQSLINEAKMMDGESIAYSSLAMRDRSDKLEIIQKYTESFMFLLGKFDSMNNPLKIELENKKVKAETNVLNQSGHMIHLEEPEVALTVILSFLIKKRKP